MTSHVSVAAVLWVMTYDGGNAQQHLGLRPKSCGYAGIGAVGSQAAVLRSRLMTPWQTAAAVRLIAAQGSGAIAPCPSKPVSRHTYDEWESSGHLRLELHLSRSVSCSGSLRFLLAHLAHLSAHCTCAGPQAADNNAVH